MIGRLSTNVRSGAGAVSRMGDGSLISSGDWWLSDGIDPANCIAAYQAKGAASYAASKVNLANPGTYNLSEVVGTVTWSSTDGFVGDKTNYFDTGVSPCDLNWTAIIRVADLIYDGSEEQLFGHYTSDGSDDRFMSGIITSSRYYFGYGDSYTTADIGYQSSGVYAMTKDYGYYDGRIYMSYSPRIFTQTKSVYLLARNYLANPVPTNAKIQAFALYNITLTLEQISALTDAMNLL